MHRLDGNGQNQLCRSFYVSRLSQTTGVAPTRPAQAAVKKSARRRHTRKLREPRRIDLSIRGKLEELIDSTCE